MKKLLFSVLLGMVLMVPAHSFADDIMNVIGKKVDGTFPLKINDKWTNKHVIDIDGVSYLSVHDAAELFGYDIFFDDTDKEVHLLEKDYIPSPDDRGSGTIVLTP